MDIIVWKWGLFVVGILLWLLYALIEVNDCERWDHKIFCLIFGVTPSLWFLYAVGMYFYNQFF